MLPNQKKADYSKLIRLQIPSQPRFVSHARDLLFSVARHHSFSLSSATDLKIAFGEVLANVIKHAYSNEDDHPIFIEIKLEFEKIEVRVKDFGKKAKPTKMRSLDLNDYRESGLGLFLIKHLTDHYYLDENQSIGNETVLIKKK